MQIAVTAHLPFLTGRPARRTVSREPRPTPTASPTQLARRAAGPQDSAFYSCACGFAFTASVSTTVGCPHCGTCQAW